MPRIQHGDEMHRDGTHAASHADGGTDEVAVEGLPTAETDAALVLAPDGTGGVEFRAEAGGGTDDQTAVEVPFTPAGTIAATDTQAAVEEVASDAATALAAHELGDLADVDLTTTPPISTDVLAFDGTDWVPVAPGSPGAHVTSHEDGGADELEIADLATSEADTALVLHPDGSGGVAWGTDATGGGGGGWTQTVNESGASFANWTSIAGTWSSTGAVITQTDTGTSRAAHYNTLYRMARQVIELDMQIITNAGSNYAGVVVGSNNAASNGGIQVRLLRGTGVQVERYGVANIRTHTVTINAATWYTLKLDIAGGHVVVYLDGTLLGSTRVAPTGIADYFLLWTFAAEAQFRNIEVWTPDLPT